MTRDADGYLYHSNGERLSGGMAYPITFPLSFESEALWSGKSLISSSSVHPRTLYSIASWQFVTLNAWTMGEPQPIQRTGGMIRLRSDGSNIAEFLKDILERDRDVFDGIIETLQFVLPYMREIRPDLTDALGQQVHLNMTESDFSVKGWLLSTGTLRILCLLALFRHPEPPPLIIIEEIENGLDPRTIHLIVEEIRNVVESGQIASDRHNAFALLAGFVGRCQDIVWWNERRPANIQSARMTKAELKSWAENFRSRKTLHYGQPASGDNMMKVGMI